MKHEVLRLERVSLSDPNTLYLKDFSLDIFEGEIMGLLAVDGHGLSALIDLLRTNPPIQNGYVYYRGQQVNNRSKARASYNRIGIIQRESSLIDDLSVVENIFVLRPGFRTTLIRKPLLCKQLQHFWEDMGLSIPPNTYVRDISPFERCVVELIKAIVTGCRLILLRDISTILSEIELICLYEIIRFYAAQGFSFLYIGFHMEELRQICGRIAVLDNAQIIKVLQPSEPLYLCDDDYFQLVQKHVREKQRQIHSQEVVFEAENLCSGKLQNLSFSVSAGECVVLQDLSHQPFSDLLPALIGDQPLLRGEFRLDGKHFSPKITRQIAIIQERPFRSMLFPSMSYLDNLCFTIDDRINEVWRDANVRKGLRKACVERFGDDLFDVKLENLTRAQQYDLIYRRILLQNPKVVFCIQPFADADMVLRMHIFDLLKGLLWQGIAVVILAVNLADSLSLADRLIRVHQNCPNEIYERKDFADLPFNAPFSEVFQSI